MGDIFNIFDKIKDNWREWQSIPYAFFSLAGLYAWLAFKVDVLQTPATLIFSHLFFLVLFSFILFSVLSMKTMKRLKVPMNRKQLKGKTENL